MSIFSSATNYLKSAASNVGNYISNAASNAYKSVTGLFSGSSQTAAAVNTFGSPAYIAKNVSAGIQPTSGIGSAYYNPNRPGAYTTPQGTYGNYYGSSAGVNSYGGVGNGSYGPQLPVKISAGVQSIAPVKPGFSSSFSTSTSPFVSSSSSGSYSIPSFGKDTVVNYGPAPTTTISARSLGAQPSAAGSLSSVGGGYSQPLTLSSAPTSVNPGRVNASGLAGNLAGYKKYNAATGQYEDVPEDQVPQTDQQTADRTKSLMDSILGKKPDIYSDPEVAAARQQRQQIQQSLQAPTAELNAVIAQQNRDLLQLRQTGAQEGVTEAVYGGQQNAINYNAAIRSLPLQAHISSLQGDLRLAQDYLDELTQVKTQQINNQYEYNKSLFSAISGAIDKKDQRAYDELKTQNDRTYEEHTNLINTQAALLKSAVSQGAPQGVVNAINGARDIQGAVMAAGRYAGDILERQTKQANYDKIVAEKNQLMNSLPAPVQTRVQGVAGQFDEKSVVKNFNQIAQAKAFADSIPNKTKNPSDDQGLIYAFAKIMDPDSVVREGEYQTVQKYSQSWVQSYGKSITQAINGTGFLSEDARSNIKKTINTKYNVAQRAYKNAYDEYGRRINKITGKTDGTDYITDYAQAFSSTEKVSPELQSLRSKYNY